MSRIAVYPATLDPIHYGHIDVAIRAAKIFDQVVVAIYENPRKSVLLPLETRIALAQQAFQDYGNIEVKSYSSLTVEFARAVQAKYLVRGLRVFGDFEFEFRMGIANKKLAPEIETIAIMSDEKYIHISSSTMREIAELGGDVSSMAPPYVNEALKKAYHYL